MAAKKELDSVYFLKILLYLVLGCIWISFDGRRLLPAGLLLGLVAVQHEKLQIDRKVEYAILLVGAVLGLIGIGVTVRL